jgi:bifunctional UDP-N-acetylglucosamine pyrophosphorylase/glucosamine-1-phosphate N-acetyltransferase/UDP-N-acetylglucosamine pyrophosphorylase
MSVKQAGADSVGAPIAVVLAAGKGTRMGSDLPKVAFEAAGKPLVRWVIEALAAAGIHDTIVVVGHRAEVVEEAVAGCPGLSFARQREQRGTGDAVRAAAGLLEARLRDADPGISRPVVIVCGDSPMLRPASVTGLLDEFSRRRAACLLGTAITSDATGLGRIVRGPDGRFQRIVEERDATPAEQAIREVNMSTYVFEARDLLAALARLDDANAAGEYYLTDCPGLLLAAGKVVDAVACLDASETLSVNTPQQLAEVGAALAARPPAAAPRAATR